MHSNRKLQSIFESLLDHFPIGRNIVITDVDKAFREKLENSDEWPTSLNESDRQIANFRSEVERAVQEFLAEQKRLQK